MAIRQILVDDVDGSEGAVTRHFAIGNINYAADLTDANYAKLEKALEPFIAVARRKGAKPKVKTVGKATKVTAVVPNDTIREWAGKQGIKVSDRGKIPKDVVDRFDAEHNGAKTPAFSG